MKSMDSVKEQQSNKFFWSDYKAPRYCWPSEKERAKETETAETDTEEQIYLEDHSNTGTLPENSYHSFTLRHLKQGATGAYKTWPAAEVLLNYLVCRGGLRDVQHKIFTLPDGPATTILDLTGAPAENPPLPSSPSRSMNILELGAGSGYLGVGLSLSLNREACFRYNNTHSAKHKTKFQPKVRVMCTDNDRATIKNMRYNIANQPRQSNVSKAVRVEPLSWGDAIGGDNFSIAVESFFGHTASTSYMKHTEAKASANDDNDEKEDPIRLLTHLIASDVHYGHTTLEPLSSVISAVKLRNPQIVVVLLLIERSPDAVADLKAQIEAKVECRLRQKKKHNPLEDTPTSCRQHAAMDDDAARLLQGFSVSVRDVLHNEISKMKMVEC